MSSVIERKLKLTRRFDSGKTIGRSGQQGTKSQSLSDVSPFMGRSLVEVKPARENDSQRHNCQFALHTLATNKSPIACRTRNLNSPILLRSPLRTEAPTA